MRVGTRRNLPKVDFEATYADVVHKQRERMVVRHLAPTALLILVIVGGCSSNAALDPSPTNTASGAGVGSSSAATAPEGTVVPGAADLVATPSTTASADAAAPHRPVRVILDTDFTADVDDVGALAVLHALSDLGEADLLAVTISDLGDGAAPGAIRAINSSYGRPEIPVGMVDEPAPQHPSRYTAALTEQFDMDIVPSSGAVDLFREALAAEPDGSVRIVSIGFLTNLARLLASPPDKHSTLDGADLVAAKVDRLVVMGGHFPDSVDHPQGAEFNLAQDADAAVATISSWPTPIIFSGWEVGRVILTGGALSTTPPNNPVRVAYELFNGGEDHFSYDLTAAYVAVRGTADFFDVVWGRAVVDAGGGNRWEYDEAGMHGYLRTAADEADIAAALSALLVATPSALRE